MTDTEQKLILYWSGELDDAAKTEVDILLAEDTDARAFLEEMDQLGDDLKQLSFPEAPSGLVSQTVDEALSSEVTPIPTVRPQKSRMTPVLWGAAALVVLSLGLLFIPQSEDRGTPIATATPEVSSVSGVETPPEVSRPQFALSKTLFKSGSAFASTLDDRSENRQRRARLRRISNSIRSKI